MDHPAWHLGALAAFATSVTWAFAAARYAEAVRSTSGVRVNLVRALVASALWVAASLVFDGLAGLGRIDARSALLLTASIACSYAIGDNVFFAAAKRIGTSSALAIAAIYPLWAALYGALFEAEPFGALRALGLFCCLGGIVALLRQSRSPAQDLAVEARPPSRERRVEARPGARERNEEAQRTTSRGVALAILTSLFWAGNSVFLKLGAEGLSVTQANAARFSVGTLLLLVQLPFQRAPQLAEPLSLTKLARVLALPLLADAGLGSICYTYGIANTDLALGATLSSLSPLVALPIAALSGNERITLAKMLAVSVTVGGVILLILPT